jgi:hypothetical protein
MSDKEQLLAMGFDSARIDCECTDSLESHLTRRGAQGDQERRVAGGTVARCQQLTIQPAMDHLINNADNPIPSSTAEDVDEDDDDAVHAHIKKMGGTVDDSDLVAKVGRTLDVKLTPVDQVQRMRQGVPIPSHG